VSCCSLSREGNFGLHSTRFNYSCFYGIAPLPTSTGIVHGPTGQLTTATGCAAGYLLPVMILAGALRSRKNAHSASGSLQLRGREWIPVWHLTALRQTMSLERKQLLRLHNTINLRRYATNLCFKLRNNSRVRRIGKYVFLL